MTDHTSEIRASEARARRRDALGMQTEAAIHDAHYRNATFWGIGRGLGSLAADANRVASLRYRGLQGLHDDLAALQTARREGRKTK